MHKKFSYKPKVPMNTPVCMNCTYLM